MAQNQEQNQKIKIENGKVYVDQEYIEPIKLLLDKGRAVYYSVLGSQLKSASIYFINKTIVVKGAITAVEDGYVLWFKYVHDMLGDSIEFTWRTSHEIEIRVKDKEVKGRAVEMCALYGEAKVCVNLENYADALYRKAINDLGLW